MKCAYALFLVVVFCTPSNSQDKTDNTWSETNTIPPSQGPQSITRTIIQDRKGHIWMAAFDGVFRFDGRSFTNITKEVSSARFFSVLEDRKGNLWFGSIGSGVYRYDGNSLQNFTTNEGLLSNEIVCIYEDKNGDIWFGASGGASLYDGRSFRNFLIDGDSIREDRTGRTVPNLQRPMHEVNSIVEDTTGRFWFGTRGNTFVYDGKTFTTVTNDGKPFINVRWIIKDKKGNIWLGGQDGLWRYDGTTFISFTKNFVGYICEDKNGNIWTSADGGQHWLLSRYDEKSLSDGTPTVTEMRSEHKGNKGMTFGILEADDGSIWYGALDGVHRYGENIINGFIGKAAKD